MMQNKPLALLQTLGMMLYNFIQQYKYPSRYEIFWRFAAGLLSGKALNKFFDALNQGPQDLIGLRHKYLIMHCLQESNGRVPINLQQSLESDWYGWLQFEIKKWALTIISQQDHWNVR